MAVKKFKKIRIVSHYDVLDPIVGEIQRLGCCEIIGKEIDAGAKESTASGGVLKERDKLSLEIDANLSDARFLLRFLEPLFVEGGNKLERMLGPKPAVSISELSTLLVSTDLSAVASEARTLERDLSEVRSEIAQISNQIMILDSIRDFELPMWLLSKGTEKVIGIMGSVPSVRTDELRQNFEDTVKGQGDLYIAPVGAKQQETNAVLLFERNLESKVMESAAQSGFSRVECPQGLDLPPSFELERLEALKADLLHKAASVETASVEMSRTWVPVIRKIHDFLSVSVSRREASYSGETTEKVSILRFWVPEDRVTALKNVLEPWEKSLDILIEDPEHDESPPIILDNPGWATPFSPLTKLYGMPSYRGIDPTVLMAPFFFLFFGMCLGDGGYGLIMGAFFLYALLRFKMVGEKKNFFVLLLLGSISTVVVGAVTGSWLGDMIDAFGILSFLRPLKESVVLLRPMSDPITFLGISLALGVVQILFGIMIAMWDAFRKGDLIGALGDQGGWLALITGLLLWGASISGTGGFSTLLAGKLLAVVGTITLILTQGRDKPGFVKKAVFGVLSLYNVTSYLGDVLSYSRLLALGLATSAIAMIVNTLTGLVSGIPYLGWLLAGLIFFGGHLFSVVVNVLGAFIHSLRLQYVEFFSKFYSGGGRVFSPLRFETRYTSIKDVTDV